MGIVPSLVYRPLPLVLGMLLLGKRARAVIRILG